MEDEKVETVNGKGLDILVEEGEIAPLEDTDTDTEDIDSINMITRVVITMSLQINSESRGYIDEVEKEFKITETTKAMRKMVNMSEQLILSGEPGGRKLGLVLSALVSEMLKDPEGTLIEIMKSFAE